MAGDDAARSPQRAAHAAARSRFTVFALVIISVINAVLLGQTLTGLLFGVTSTDPVTFGAMTLLVAIVAAIAGYLPARRASRIDPIAALRAS